MGGECDFTLGESTATIKILGCDWERKETQNVFKQQFGRLPAAILEVEITEIKDSDDRRLDNVWSAFQDPPLIRTIDMTDIGAETNTLNEYEEEKFEGDTGTAKDDQASDSSEGALEEEEKVRFQYDGVMSMAVSFENNDVVNTTDCFDKEIYPNADSFHVIEYMSLFTARIDVWHDINGQRCDAVDEKYKVVVTNNVGLEDAEASGFKRFYNALDSLTKEALAICSNKDPPGGEAPGPCVYDILHDDDGRKAGVDTSFATGRPRIDADYEKSIMFSVIGGTEDVTHNANIFISGLYSKGPGNSFALPTHQPIMVLRDPPGGSSYASYENIVTTAKVVTSSTHVSGEGKLSLSLFAGLDAEAVTCAGGGLGAIVLACPVSPS